MTVRDDEAQSYESRNISWAALVLYFTCYRLACTLYLHTMPGMYRVVP